MQSLDEIRFANLQANVEELVDELTNGATLSASRIVHDELHGGSPCDPEIGPSPRPAVELHELGERGPTPRMPREHLPDSADPHRVR